jgi:hypothetical protein
VVFRGGIDIGDGEGVREGGRGEGGHQVVVAMGDQLSSDNVQVPRSDGPLREPSEEEKEKSLK